MYRSFSLSPVHFASKWTIPADELFNDRKAVNLLAIDYATMEDGEAKQALFLRILECFHGYLMKYTNMVIRGQLPNLKSPSGKDASQFLKTLLPKALPASQVVLSNVCRTLHLAFKQMTTDDVYDVMVLCFLKASRRYDPFYTVKVREVCEVIDGTFAEQKQFTASDITGSISFNALACLRLLVRKQYLESVHGPKKKVIGFTRGPNWPPPKSFFESGPVGFTYFAQMWFRYYLQDHISQSMGELETQDGVLQLGATTGEGNSDYSLIRDGGVPSVDGAYTDREGNTWSADTTLMTQQFDIGQMTDDWVRGTDDKFFRNLTPQERLLLQMVFRNDSNWVEIGVSLGCTAPTAKQMFSQILLYLRGHANVTVKKSEPKHERPLGGTGSVGPDPGPHAKRPDDFEPMGLGHWKDR